MLDALYFPVMMLIGVIVAAIVGAVLFQQYEQKKAEKNAAAIIHQTFAGKNIAHYKIPRIGGSLPYSRIVHDAHIMGFQLVGRKDNLTGTTLTFQRNAPSPAPHPWGQ